MGKIAPSILSADFTKLEKEIKSVEKAGADYIHIDVMDGHFVPNITIGPMIVAAVSRITKLPLDVHLMISQPDLYLEHFAQAGADIIGVHVEILPHLHRTLQRIKELGRKASVTLNPGTPLVAVEQVLGQVDQILLMTVNPGFGGQDFIEAVIPRLRRFGRLLINGGWRWKWRWTVVSMPRPLVRWLEQVLMCSWPVLLFFPRPIMV